jgi:hypothetical protein
MAAKGGLGPEGYKRLQEASDILSGKRVVASRNDGLDMLIPNRTLAQASDPDFGIGYEVMDAKSANPLGRARAQRIGYNKELQYLAILMRDDTLVGYPGVSDDEWEDYANFSSTTDYIETVLSRYSNGRWENKTLGNLPQSNPQNFTQGTID